MAFSGSEEQVSSNHSPYCRLSVQIVKMPCEAKLMGTGGKMGSEFMAQHSLHKNMIKMNCATGQPRPARRGRRLSAENSGSANVASGHKLLLHVGDLFDAVALGG